MYQTGGRSRWISSSETSAPDRRCGYQVVVSRRAATDVRRLPQPEQRAVLAALDALGERPRAGTPLVGELARVWSLRRGDYRILYGIDDAHRRVELAHVPHRRDVYRRKR